MLNLTEVQCVILGDSASRQAGVPTHAGKSWKVLKFKKEIFQAWKVIENDCVHGKSWNYTNRS